MSDSQWRNQRELLDKITKDLLTLIEKKDITDTLNRIAEQVNIRINEEKKREIKVILSKNICDFLGISYETKMSEEEVISKIFTYINVNNLFTHIVERKYVILDDKLIKLLNLKLNRYIMSVIICDYKTDNKFELRILYTEIKNVIKRIFNQLRRPKGSITRHNKKNNTLLAKTLQKHHIQKRQKNIIIPSEKILSHNRKIKELLNYVIINKKIPNKNSKFSNGRDMYIYWKGCVYLKKCKKKPFRKLLDNDILRKSYENWKVFIMPNDSLECYASHWGISPKDIKKEAILGYTDFHGLKTENVIWNELKYSSAGIGVWYYYRSDMIKKYKSYVLEELKNKFNKKEEIASENIENTKNRLTTETWYDNLEKTKLFINTHKNIPSQHSKNKVEKMLGCWIGKQVTNYKKKIGIIKDVNIRKSWEEFLLYFKSKDEFAKYFIDIETTETTENTETKEQTTEQISEQNTEVIDNSNTIVSQLFEDNSEWNIIDKQVENNINLDISKE